MSPKSGNDIAYGHEADVNSSGRITVRDTLVRVFHWSLVAAVSIAALTGFVLGQHGLKYISGQAAARLP